MDDFMNISDAIRSIIKPHTDDVLAPLSTVFSETMDREKPWQEYPRPQLVRDSYFSLNGFWDYAITGDRMLPLTGRSLFPFPRNAPSPESDGICSPVNISTITGFSRRTSAAFLPGTGFSSILVLLTTKLILC
jgi:hypothetical protein